MKPRTLIQLIALSLITVATNPQTASNIRFSNTTPSPPAGATNVLWQHDSAQPISNISAYVLYPNLQVACPSSGDLGAPVPMNNKPRHLLVGNPVYVYIAADFSGAPWQTYTTSTLTVDIYHS